MKPKHILVWSIVLLSLAFSCNPMHSSPNKTFQTIGLNSNKIPRSFERHFNELRQRKAQGYLQVPTADGKSMQDATCQEFVDYFYAQTFDRDIENVKKLNPTDEAKAIVEAGLDMFQYADEILKNDYPVIAKMIDEGESDDEIDTFIQQLDATKGMTLDEKYEKTMSLLLPYADSHGVEYKTIGN